MRDLHHNIKIVSAILPQVVTSAGGAVSSSDDVLDLAGFGSAEIIVDVGASGDTLSGTVKLTVSVQHADEDASTPDTAGTYAAVTTADLLGATSSSGDVLVIDDPAEDSAAYSFGYIGTKRFLKVTVTPGGTHTNGTPLGVVLVKGHPDSAPVA